MIMKRLFVVLLFAVSSTCSMTGCGEPTYDIPEIDEEESKQNEQEINKAMEKAMEEGMRGGKKKKK